MTNNCPKCNFDLRGEDIYQHFLKEYSKKIEYPVRLYEVLAAIHNYPDFFKDAPSEEELRKMTHIELNAWKTASMYGWTKKNPLAFKKEIGIEISGVYDGVIIYKCPNCNHLWKRFDFVPDKYLK